MPIATYTNFSGGLNKQQGVYVIDPGDGSGMQYAYDSKNFEMAQEGLIRNPSIRLHGSGAYEYPIGGIFQYRKSNGTLELIVIDNTTIYRVSASSKASLATLSSLSVTAGYWQALQYQDVLIMCNAVNTPLIYNGTTVTAASYTDPDTIWDNAKPEFVDLFRNRVFYGGYPTKPHRLYTPIPESYDDYTNTTDEADAFDVSVGSDAVLTGFVSLTDDIAIIFKENCIRRLSGSSPFGSVGIDEFSLADVTNEVGCIAPRSIVQVGNDLLFLAKGGVRQFSTTAQYGDVAQARPSYLVQPLMKALNYSQSTIKNACSVFDPQTNKAWFFVPSGSNTVNNKAYIYDVVTKAWQEANFGSITTSSAGISATGVFDNQAYFGASTSLYVIDDSTFYQSDGAYWESFWIAHEGLSTYKAYRKLVIHAEFETNPELTIQWKVLRRGSEYSDTGTFSTVSSADVWGTGVWGTAIWANPGSQGLFHRKYLGRGNAIKLKLSTNENNEQPKIRAIEIHYEVLGTARG